MNQLKATIAGWALALLFFFLWLDSRENLAAEISRCNEVQERIGRESSEAARAAERAANEERIAQLRRDAIAAEDARLELEKAYQEADSRPERVQVVIRESASENECLNTALPADLIDSLR